MVLFLDIISAGIFPCGMNGNDSANPNCLIFTKFCDVEFLNGVYRLFLFIIYSSYLYTFYTQYAYIVVVFAIQKQT